MRGRDLLPDGGSGNPVDVLDPPPGPQATRADPQMGTGCLTDCDLTLLDGDEVLLVCRACVMRVVSEPAASASRWAGRRRVSVTGDLPTPLSRSSAQSSPRGSLTARQA